MPPRMRRRITTAKLEEIENEQKILDNKIVRPFETLNGLPISYNAPPYGNYEEILKNPLTIKDSAVLYNSLIRSRKTYVYHAPMFKLHWVKQTTYAKKLAEMDKEKQKEILKDSSNRKRFAKATTNSLEARTRIPVLSPDVNARDVMSKLCEASMTLGPHTMDIRIFIAKDARSEKSRAIEEIKKFGGKPAEAENPIKPEQPVGVTEGTSSGASSLSQQYSSIGRPSPFPKAAEAEKLSPSVGATEKKPTSTVEDSRKTEVNTEQQSLNENKASNPHLSAQRSPAISNSDNIIIGARGFSSKATSSSGSGITEDQKDSTGVPAKSTESETVDKGSGSVDKSNSDTKQKSISDTASDKPEPKPPAQAARPPPANLQSVDNTIMISNLNAIAKVDVSLNDLMKEVASGKASEVQISTFKRYIERAKQMGPQPHHAELYFSKGLPLPPNFPKPYQSRPIERRPTALPRMKMHNPMKLTAFQEKYLHNATLVFEFLENPNVRYIIPQDSICEVLEPQLPAPADAEEGTDFNDVLFSFIWVHNIDEVESYEKKLQEYEAEIAKKEEEERIAKEEEEKKQKEESEKAEDEQPAETPQPDARASRTKKKVPPPKKKKPLVPPEEPTLRFTSFSFTVHNIPSRYVPIVRNSMKPLKQVQEKMSKILSTGNRVTSFYLWYKVDARLDEGFAEDLRNAAVEEEKEMTGFMPPVEAKKRKPRDYKAMRLKKLKESSGETAVKAEEGIGKPPFGAAPSSKGL